MVQARGDSSRSGPRRRAGRAPLAGAPPAVWENPDRMDPSRKRAIRLTAALTAALLLAAALLVCTAVAGPYGAAPLSAIVDALHLGSTMLWLGGTIVIALAGPLGQKIRSSPVFRRRQRTVTGAIMIGLGTYLATSESK